jgi:two-component system, OmpR family, sensor histidine kinase KdpD
MPDNDRADAFLHMIRRAQRGRLKIYLGYCAGVGKTYQMLQEGHRLKEEGIDLVAGLVEAHGREDIQRLSEGLEVIPRRRVEYHGVIVEEMDVDAILARKPQVALIDELAHTNVPGSRNAKRYQDVQDILATGIHVISTLNVQHLESLYDTVERAIQVKVRERVPDTIIAEADQIVNVDLTTEDLRKRLLEGKIYPSGRVGSALSNFFISSNLEKLRELTLRELASQIDLRRREASEEEEIAYPDQVMVCLSSRGPNSEMLLRYASRLAGKLNRSWYAVYVQTPSEEPTVIDAGTQRILSGTLTLAKQLGAMVFTYKGEDIPDTILRFAREYRVGHVVVGRPGPLSFWERLTGKKSVVNHLINKAKGMTLVLIDTQKELPSLPKKVPESPIQVIEESSASAGDKHFLLSALVSDRRIFIWDQPIHRDTVIRTLSAAIAQDTDNDAETIFRRVMERERQGSTFFNEGAGFPHIRMDGITEPLVAVGLTHAGVIDVSTEKPIELIFLIVSPLETPDTQIQVLSITSQAAQNRHLLQSLKSVSNPAEALEEIQRWEIRKEAGLTKS